MIDIYESAAQPVHPTKVIGICLNTYDMDEAAGAGSGRKGGGRSGLPATDPVRFDSARWSMDCAGGYGSAINPYHRDVLISAAAIGYQSPPVHFLSSRHAIPALRACRIPARLSEARPDQAGRFRWSPWARTLVWLNAHAFDALTVNTQAGASIDPRVQRRGCTIADDQPPSRCDARGS